jgi:hypothetical protein
MFDVMSTPLPNLSATLSLRAIQTSFTLIDNRGWLYLD